MSGRRRLPARRSRSRPCPLVQRSRSRRSRWPADPPRGLSTVRPASSPRRSYAGTSHVSVTEARRKRAALSPGRRQNGRMEDDRVNDALARDERLRPVLDAVSGVGRSGVYLVGGTVRDILLGESAFDVDLAVEGDGQEFAQALAKELAGSVRPHDAFGTAV